MSSPTKKAPSPLSTAQPMYNAPMGKSSAADKNAGVAELKQALDKTGSGKNEIMAAARADYEKEIPPIDPKFNEEERIALAELAANVSPSEVQSAVFNMMQEEVKAQEEQKKIIEFAEKHFTEIDPINLFLAEEIVQTLPLTANLYVELRVGNGTDDAHVMSAAKQLTEAMVGPVRVRAVQKDREALSKSARGANMHAFRELQEYIEIESEVYTACVLACTVIGYKKSMYSDITPVNPAFDPRASMSDGERINKIAETASLLMKKPSIVRKRMWLYQAALTMRVRKVLNDEVELGLAVKS